MRRSSTVADVLAILVIAVVSAAICAIGATFLLMQLWVQDNTAYGVGIAVGGVAGAIVGLLLALREGERR